MRLNLLVRLASFLLILAGSTVACAAAPVEYVRICSLYGADYYYVPGTDLCLNPTTGVTKTETPDGTMTSQTALAGRLGELESTSCDGCFAVVTKMGVKRLGFHVTHIVRLKAGLFRVKFDKDVATCGLTATIGDGKSAIPGFTTVASAGSNLVLVRTFNIRGALEDRGFHLSVNCPTGPTAP